MKPNAIVPLIGLLILGLFACVLPPPTTLQARALVAATVTTPPYCGDPANMDPFINHVHFLKSPFVPQYPFNQSPPIDDASLETIAASTNIQSDLIDAFNRSGKKFKEYLCTTLDAILINPCVPNSYDPSTCGIGDLDIAKQTWGLRTPSPPPKRYVALSLALWRGGHAPALHEFKTRRLQALLGTLGTPSIPLPEFTKADPDAPGMSVLALLAHRVGTYLLVRCFRPFPGRRRHGQHRYGQMFLRQSRLAIRPLGAARPLARIRQGPQLREQLGVASASRPSDPCTVREICRQRPQHL